MNYKDSVLQSLFQISALSGFWVTSVILQVPITAFSILNTNIPLPLERILYLYHGVFLLIEVYLLSTLPFHQKPIIQFYR